MFLAAAHASGGVNLDQALAVTAMVVAPGMALAGFVYRNLRARQAKEDERNAQIDLYVLPRMDAMGVPQPGFLMAQILSNQASNTAEHASVTAQIAVLSDSVRSLEATQVEGREAAIARGAEQNQRLTSIEATVSTIHDKQEALIADTAQVRSVFKDELVAKGIDVHLSPLHTEAS